MSPNLEYTVLLNLKCQTIDAFVIKPLIYYLDTIPPIRKFLRGQKKKTVLSC